MNNDYCIMYNGGFALSGEAVFMKTTIKLILSVALCFLINGCGQVNQSPIDNNLSGWSCYLEDAVAIRQGKAYAVEDGSLVCNRYYYFEDADDKQQVVWKIEDGMLVCSGTPRGYLYTNESYRDFTLTLQWRWPDEKSAGKGGVLIDMTGVYKIWPKSLEAQINADSAGDFWALDGYELVGATDRMKSLSHPEYGELINVSKMEAAENPAGQWNSYKIVADGANVTLIVNGQVVNKATRTNKTGGKICITSEGTGIEFKDIKISPK
jgi:hypothetical protein